ncbi:MAG: polysaccharide biosynthesis protein [Longimicrobiales bacterium]|jgi:FlaA1/EpsC-like NDP-sugar epimerase
MPERLHPVLRFAHRNRPRVASLVYAGATGLALWLAFLLRFDSGLPLEQIALFWEALPWLVGLRLGIAFAFGLTMGRWRFVGIYDVTRLTAAIAVGSVVFFVLSWPLAVLPRVPRSILLIEAVVNEYLVAFVWLSYRMGFERFRHWRFPKERRRVLVVGAGDAGSTLVREMHRVPSGRLPVGVVDDDSVKWGTSLHGVRVWGGIDQLPRLAVKLKVEEVLIAVPSAEPPQIQRIVEKCEEAGRDFSILPGVAEVLSGEAHLEDVREVRVEDLLGRDPVVMQLPEVRSDIADLTIMITGAAGSIGSELARQVALHEPARLLLVDQAETPLYYIDLELRSDFPDLEIVPIIADVANADSVEAAFKRYSPERVFHSAAYKHVPMMELHPSEAVRNNVVGTWLVADAAGRHGAEKLVLVSTDKAVQPLNVMGATKRMAELTVLQLQRRYPETSYGAVRFGNVLGSNGSVLPLFRRQFAERKPLTVTHEDVSRYFMTIPEAVQLILKTSVLPELGGHVAMLEMGDPVKILDLAKNFLRLSGQAYRPGENVIFTGLRPGEKLEEELVAPEERVLATDISKVRLIVSDPEDHPGGRWLSEAEFNALEQENVSTLVSLLRQRWLDAPVAASVPTTGT